MIQLIPPGTKDPKLYELLGLAQAILGNFRASADAFKKAVDFQKGHPQGDLISLAIRAMAIAGDAFEARAMSQDGYRESNVAPNDSRTRMEAMEVKLAEMFSNLYSRGGYDRALQIGSELMTDEEAKNSGRLGCTWLRRMDRNMALSYRPVSPIKLPLVKSG